jgi:hypothetical protein
MKMNTFKWQALLLLAFLEQAVSAFLYRAFGQPDSLALGNIGPTSGATIRADINIKVEEAAGAEDMLIGLRAMPALGVDSKSGTYPKIQIAAGELLTQGATERTPGGSYGEASRQWTSDTYDCVDRGLEEPVDDSTARDLARFFNVEVATARWVMRNMLLAHEVRVAAAIINATTFGAGTNSTVAYTEANIATISFVADVLAAIERVRNNGTNPDTIIMSSTVYNRIRRGTLVTNFVSGSVGKGSEVTSSTLAQAFGDEGIRQVLVGKARYNSAKKGQAHSATNVWGNTYVWVGKCNPAAQTPQDGGAGFTFYWNAEGGLFVSETYRDEKRRSNMVRVRQNTTEKVTDATSGTLITTQYS